MGIWATLAFLIIFIPGVVIIDAQLTKTGETAIELATPPPAAAPASAPKPQPKNQPTKVEAYVAAKEPPKTIEKPSPPKPMERIDTTQYAAAGGASGGGAPGGMPGGIIGGTPGGAADAPPPPPPPPPPPKEEPKPEPPKIVRKSGGVLQGSATRSVTPTYPPLARAARVSGSVVVEVTVDEAGNVMSARAVSGHPLLKDAAVCRRARLEIYAHSTQRRAGEGHRHNHVQLHAITFNRAFYLSAGRSVCLPARTEKYLI